MSQVLFKKADKENNSERSDDAKPSDMVSPFDTDKIKAQLRYWQDKLLDLSRANPLLSLNKSRTARLSVVTPESDALFQAVVVEGEKLKMPFVRRVPRKNVAKDGLFDTLQEVEAAGYEYKLEKGDLAFADMPPAEIRRRLNRIYDNAKTTIEERGLITFYLTLGAIHWQDDYFGESVSPLILIPCQFVYKGPNSALQLEAADDDIQLNPTVDYFLREKHKIELPELSPDLDSAGMMKFLDKVGSMVASRGWEVSREAWLGTFNFESMVLFKDLDILSERALTNSTVAAFSRASDEALKNEALGDDLDVLATPGVVPIPVKNADSSQLEALTYVAMGQNLVIHGPPGTGKSQTITNIIADALGKNKKILFVSAKIAALNVVYDRLKEIGLGDFCLEAHSTKAGKQKIADELRRTIETQHPVRVESLEDDLDALQRTRDELNKYARLMNSQIEPLGVSLYQAIGQYFKIGGVEVLKFPLPWDRVMDVSRQEFDVAYEALQSLTQVSDMYNRRREHPLRGLEAMSLSVEEKEKLEDHLLKLQRLASSYTGELSKLNGLICDPTEMTYDQLVILAPTLGKVARLDYLPVGWSVVVASTMSVRAQLLREAADRLNELSRLRSEYKKYTTIQPAIFSEKLKDIRKYSGLFSRLTLSYWRWAREIRSSILDGIKLNFRTFELIHSLTEEMAKAEEWLEKSREFLTSELGESNWQEVSEVLKAEHRVVVAIELREVLELLGKKASQKDHVISQEVGAAAAVVSSSVPEQQEEFQALANAIDSKWPHGFCGDFGVPHCVLPALVARSEEVAQSFGLFREWIQLQRHIQRCIDVGLSPMLQALMATSAVEYPELLKKRFLRLWIDGASSGVDVFADFSSYKQHELISKLRILDARISDLNLKKIRAQAGAAIRRIKSAQSEAGTAGEVGILQFELQRKKRIKPLRKLFGLIPHVLQAIKPCMLMSPISVSTYLHPDKFAFDLVIFDEASQLPPAEAIPSILRASQVIVAGDSRQLPPTSFFESSIVEEDEYQDDDEVRAESLESLLDNCVAVVPAFQQALLKWHYRSRDERLINFSNHYFYNNNLITFPSNRTDSDGRGIRLEYIADGVWDRGKSRTNRREARRVAELVIEHFDKFPERSLGVVALNSYQKEAIEDAIRDELLQRDDLSHFFETEKKEPFFVKSLENVQGDERDAMIVSVGYAKDPTGALSYNFGPLSRDNGWRRLNVLVTRSKWQILLVTSLRSSDLHGVNPQSRGPLSLRNFIEYAERAGELPPDTPILVEAETNDFEEAVRAVLMDNGYKVDQQVGAGIFRIDLAIRDPQNDYQYLLGIECDGASYHSSRTARDRDLLREQVLQGMGWRLYRVWSTDWFLNQERAIEDLLDAVKRAQKLQPEKIVKTPPRDDAERQQELKTIAVPEAKRIYQSGTLYEKYVGHHRRETVMNSAKVAQLADVIINIVKVEGPIHDDLLVVRIREVFDVARAGNNITNNVGRAIARAKKSGAIIDSAGFLYSRNRTAIGFRTPSNGVKRSLRQISLEEIANAILFMIEDQFGVMRDQLSPLVIKQFEISRSGPEEVDLIQEVIDELIRAGKLFASGNHLTLGN